MSFHIALFEPEIPPNTGNIIRLCANTGARLHLIHPLGFELDDRRMRRAGLDYSEYASLVQHADYAAFLRDSGIRRLFAFSTRFTRNYSAQTFSPDDGFLFGPETRGLPQEIREQFSGERGLTVPMVAGSRSLNLSNTVALVLFEAWRQQGFSGAAAEDPE